LAGALAALIGCGAYSPTFPGRLIWLSLAHRT